MAQKTQLTILGIYGQVQAFVAKEEAAAASEAAQYSGGDLQLEITPVDWEILLQRYDGTNLIPLTPIALEWDFLIALNNLNSFSLTLNLPGLRALGYQDGLPLDSMIEFRRKRGVIRNFSFYHRDFRRDKNTYLSKGYGLNWLLAGRDTSAYYAGTSYTVKNAALDDMMKALVRENAYTSAVNRDTLAADTLRDYSQIMGFSVAGDNTACSTFTVHCAGENLFELLVKLANMSAQDGTRLFFDVFRTNDTSFVFDTRAEVYGIDRRNIRTFSESNGTMQNTVTSTERNAEITYLYVLGQGQGALRSIEEVSSTDGVNASPLNRREGSYNANQTAEADLTGVGYRVLEKYKPVKLFDGELLDIEGARYGLDWDLGDILDAKQGKEEFEIMVTGVRFSMSPGKQEKITGIFEVIS